MDERTRLIRHTTRKSDRRRTVNPPIERGTTLLNPRMGDLRDPKLGPTYGISGLTVHRELENTLAEMENAHRVLLAPTGLAAVTVPILALVESGDDIIVTDACYWPTRQFCMRVLSRFGVKTTYAPPRASPAEILSLATDRTRLILMESPGSITFEMQDIPGVARLARSRGIATMVDNTWAAGILFKPLDHGVDISVQALSKYVAGHSDVFGGSIAVANEGLYRTVEHALDDHGWYVSPDEAYMALRGLRTLPVRLAEHGRSALEIARWLEGRPEVTQVLYPALESSPDHGLWKRDFSGASGLMGIELKPGSAEAADAMVDALQLFGIGFSWGGFESLATHDSVQLKRRTLDHAFKGPIVRLNIGLEGTADLIADLRTALDRYAELTR